MASSGGRDAARPRFNSTATVPTPAPRIDGCYGRAPRSECPPPLRARHFQPEHATVMLGEMLKLGQARKMKLPLGPMARVVGAGRTRTDPRRRPKGPS